MPVLFFITGPYCSTVLLHWLLLPVLFFITSPYFQCTVLITGLTANLVLHGWSLLSVLFFTTRPTLRKNPSPYLAALLRNKHCPPYCVKPIRNVSIVLLN
jgi:hypothetical protein